MQAPTPSATPKRSEIGKDIARPQDKDGEAAMGHELVALAIASLATIAVMAIIAIASLHSPPFD